MNETISLLRQAANIIDLEAEEWRRRSPPDHMGRSKTQMSDIADTDNRMANALRIHADKLASSLTGAQ